MGDRSMKTCLEEKLGFAREHLASVGTTPQAFYNGGQDFEALDFEHDYVRESFANAWGYLEGAADMADMTITEMLGEHGLQLDAPKKRKRACPKCGGKAHRCKNRGVPGCMHCDDENCGHGWQVRS